jgi:hypothetical protein
MHTVQILSLSFLHYTASHRSIPNVEGVANNYNSCIYENVCVSNFKYHVNVLFIHIFFICLSKNSLHLLDTWPITVPHADK